VLDGISITWTPNNGPVVSAPSPYPGTPERLDNLFVHPVAVGQDSAISHYPGQDAEDVTWQDTIITFPADSGVPPLYLVFAKPAVRPLEVDIYAGDLRHAVDSNFDAIKPYLLDHGFAESDLEMARTQMHKVNENQGWY